MFLAIQLGATLNTPRRLLLPTLDAKSEVGSKKISLKNHKSFLGGLRRFEVLFLFTETKTLLRKRLKTSCTDFTIYIADRCCVSIR